MHLAVLLAACAALLLAGCRAPEARLADGGPSTRGVATHVAVRSPAARDDRLEIRLEIVAGVFEDHVPMRMAVLHFRNVGREPLRLYLPVAEASRSLVSSLLFVPAKAPPLLVPAPQPPQSVTSDQDFLLLKPGEALDVSQPFSVEQLGPGGAGPVRRPGFEAGQVIRVWWTYDSTGHRWNAVPGSQHGEPAGALGGSQVPTGLWVGQLRVEASWPVTS